MTQIAQTTIPLNISKDFLYKTKISFFVKNIQIWYPCSEITFTKTIFYENNVYTNLLKLFIVIANETTFSAWNRGFQHCVSQKYQAFLCKKFHIESGFVLIED